MSVGRDCVEGVESEGGFFYLTIVVWGRFGFAECPACEFDFCQRADETDGGGRQCSECDVCGKEFAVGVCDATDTGEGGTHGYKI